LNLEKHTLDDGCKMYVGCEHISMKLKSNGENGSVLQC